MPATENTWRDMKTMHLVFALSSAALLAVTLWWIVKDNRREWKPIQDNVVKIDQTTNIWRRQQYMTDEAARVHQTAAYNASVANSKPIDSKVVDTFERELKLLGEKLEQEKTGGVAGFNADWTRKRIAELDELAPKATEAEAVAKQATEKVDAARAKWLSARTATKNDKDVNLVAATGELEKAEAELKAADEAMLAAQSAAEAKRKEVVDYLSTDVVLTLKNQEDNAMTDRKFENANLDKAKSEVDIGVRDTPVTTDKEKLDAYSEKMLALQKNVDAIARRVDRLQRIYQARNMARVALEKEVKKLTTEQEDAKKALDASQADIARLEKAWSSRNESYFVFSKTPPFIFLGKRWLTLPILTAFNSPRKIDNLWADGLEINNNFRNVRRFDRCTTCHQQMQKSLPGAPNDPAFIPDHEFDVLVPPPTAEQRTAAAPLPDQTVDTFKQLQKLVGLRLEEVGLVNFDDVTIGLVLPNSPAAKAEPAEAVLSQEKLPSTEIRDDVASFTGVDVTTGVVKPGLMFADVVVAIEGGKVFDARNAAAKIYDLAKEGKPVRLTIRRGLQNPYTTHPRLDLFVGDGSPHKMATFACTICHEGQGSATEFKWASHSPSSPAQAEEWRKKYGWFDNHHWIYPMNPKRFAESSCLKCHHDVTELEASERFPEPPAPKLTKGYHLIRKYGCFGCHEINGFDGPSKRVGPDMRLEPNYFAAALQLKAKAKGRLEAAGSDEEVQAKFANLLELAEQVAVHPDDNTARRQLRQLLDTDATHSDPFATAEMHKLADLLKDQDTPGTQRKVGPSLRYINAKDDKTFLYDWTANPKNFRPSTRMPQFFGLWNHLDQPTGEGASPKPLTEAKDLEGAKRYEPVEIAGIVAYLQTESQDFEPVAKPEGIDESSDEEKIARGKQQFEFRGCLACHEHKDFPATKKYRGHEIVQGPNLAGLSAKFDVKRNPRGREWLYSWIKEPTRYHARTVMPNLFLDPITHSDGKVTDPAEDIVAYLLSEPNEQWKPVPQATAKVVTEDLDTLIFSYLKQNFSEETAEIYLKEGIPANRRKELKEAERELVVDGGTLSVDQKLKYIGKKTIAKYGCYACHDIPGFEDAKPIGTTLADWGRKDPAKIAFEHISHYVEHGHAGHAGGHADAHTASHDEHAAVDADSEDPGRAGFFEEALSHQHRSGFLFQKLVEPRSYDYKKTENKPYNDRLRMPLFPFTEADREAVVTFVLGLVAEPPSEKYRYKPSERQAAILAGKRAIEKFNCGGCHILQGEKWKIAFKPDQFGEQSELTTYPFLSPHFTPKDIADSAKLDASGKAHATLTGLPAIESADSLPVVVDDAGDTVAEDESYNPRTLQYGFELFDKTALAGKPFRTGLQALSVPVPSIEERFGTQGGFLAKYLAPRALELERQANPQAKGNEVWAWLPPPLMGEGRKVQTNWLHDFLLEPHPIRPAVFLRMPKFNMSSHEASDLVNYFAAVDNAEYPYEFQPQRQASVLAMKENAYQSKSGRKKGASEGLVRFNDAMQIVVNSNYCVKCHSVGDFTPTGSPRALAPNLARVYERLRPEYVRDWIANPKTILPYTAMPVNIEYDPAKPNQGGVDQKLFHGTSTEQLDGLVDLLMNFDEYAKRRAPVTPLVPPAQPAVADNAGSSN
jgi:mono/diheme cytochrome c family protein